MPSSSTKFRVLEHRVATLEEVVRVGNTGLAEKDRLYPKTAVANRYGVTPRCIDRWAADPDLGFPQPEIINTRKYWRESLLKGWDQTRLQSVGGAA